MLNHEQPPRLYDQPWPPYSRDPLEQGRPGFTPDLPPVSIRRARHRQPGQPRKRRRVFLSVFLAVQALFVAWVIAGAASGGSIHSQAVAYCHAHPSQFLPFSQCVSSYGGGAKAGAAIGLGLIILLWAVVDIIMGISYAVYQLARRPA